MSPFKVLGIKPSNSLEEAKKAYKKLVLKYHPDRPTGDPIKLQQVTEAWETLQANPKLLGRKQKDLTHQSLFNIVEV